MLNIQEIRNQFPILNTLIHQKPLVYLDNAATSQKPISVLEAWENYYKTLNANVHRGIHTLSQLATEEMETLSMLKRVMKLFLPKELRRGLI